MSYIIVNKPGDLSNNTRRERLESMIHQLESLPGAWGSNSTYYFMKDFLIFENDPLSLEANMGNEDMLNTTTKSETKFDPDDLPTFISLPEYEYWDGFIKMKNIRHVYF
jgi:hypothetical protein